MSHTQCLPSWTSWEDRWGLISTPWEVGGCTGTVLMKLELGDLLSIWIPNTKCHRNSCRSCSNDTQRHHSILCTLKKNNNKCKEERGRNLRGGGKFPSNISPILPKLCQWRWKNNMRFYTFNTPNSFCFIGIKNVCVFKVVSYTKIQVFCNTIVSQWVSGYQHLRRTHCLQLQRSRSMKVPHFYETGTTRPLT
jgi:hypothetical protein